MLLIAEAANPEWTSVPLVGWCLSQALSRCCDSHLVTQVRNRDAITRSGLTDAGFTTIDSESVARAVWRVGTAIRRDKGKGWTLVTALASVSYFWFERLVWRTFGDAIRSGAFDVVHRITPLSPTIPSSLAKQCAESGVPFILGPINGGVPWPRHFDRARRKEGEWLSYFRFVHRILPGYYSTRKHAAAIIVASRTTWAQMPVRYRHKCVYIPENAVDPQAFPAPEPKPELPPLQIAFVGRLVPCKGVDMLIEAVAPLVREGIAKLEVIGDGPELTILKSLVDRLDCGSGVTFAGWLPHADLRERLSSVHVLGFPSIREFGGAVVLEAMAAGVVPVVMNYGGPAELVTDATGCLIEMGHRSEIIRRLRRTFVSVLAKPDCIQTKSQLGRARVLRLFTWDVKASQVHQVYDWVLGRASKPDFGVPL